MTRVVGAPTATLAVATPAQAFVLAGLVRLGARRPVLMVTPTGAAADQLAHDLEAFTGGSGEGLVAGASPASTNRSGLVEVFPAWETLPFERVSPDVATMGRRLRLLWRLGGVPGTDAQGGEEQGGDEQGGDGEAGGRRGPSAVETAPDIVVAPIKAVLQRLGPWRSAARPVRVAKGEQVAVDELVATWSRPVIAGSRWSSTEGSWPSAAASSTCSRRRLMGPCASICGATRSTG